ncbi:MAG: hypothetical protein MJY44_00330 [Bacteroidales bacterium]|nr:hypothetical protein [Bacteroidales bacterium]
MKNLFLFLSTVVVFWNVENFFDTEDGGFSPSDTEFSATGAKAWTSGRFYRKSNAVARTIMLIADRFGALPDVVAFEEVENVGVLRRMKYSSILSKTDYRAESFESGDRRGIDCALMYRKSKFPQPKVYPVSVRDGSGNGLATRDILVFECDTLAVLVNHHPSQLGGQDSPIRTAALRTLRQLCDSLAGAGVRTIVAGGDFNEEAGEACDSIIGKVFRELPAQGDAPGTIRFQGRWETIDRCRTNADAALFIFSDASLLEPDRTHGGMKPKRTYVGPRYNGGVSDHLPVVVVF